MEGGGGRGRVGVTVLSGRSTSSLEKGTTGVPSDEVTLLPLSSPLPALATDHYGL